MSVPVRDYHAYGLRLRSAIPLPFDPPPEPGASGPDVTVRLGVVPAVLPDSPDAVHTALWQARPGAFLMHVEGVARYLATGGRDVLVEPLGGDDAVAAFFVNSPLTVLMQQRGVATLHAAAVATGAGAVLLLGRSGIGKSSLAAALVERGYPLLADDVTGLVLDAGGRPVALPGFSRQRLWAHTLDRMHWWGRERSRVRDGMEKYWTPAQLVCTAPLPVGAALVLEAADRPDVGIEPVPAGSAFWLLWHNTHRRWAMDAMGQRPAHFRAATATASRVPLARVTRPLHPFLLDVLADRVAAYLREVEAGGAGSVARAGPAGGEEGAAGAAFGAASETARTAGVRRAGGNGDAGMPGRSVPHRLPSPGTSRGPAGAGVAHAPGPGIVWISAWPKSGTTWLRAVLTSYLHEDGGPASIDALIGRSANHREAFDEYLGLDSSDMTDEEVARYLPRFREVLAERLFAARPPPERRRDEPGFVKTHEAYRVPGGAPRFPRAGCAGVVYLVRDPLDVAVSYAHHLSWSIDRTIGLMDDPAAHEARIPRGIFGRLPEPLTTWSGHVSSWTRQTALRLHVARYEDLLADPYVGFGEIIRFAGLEWDGARLGRAIEHTAFHRLQAQEAEAGFSEKQPTAPSFFRAGVAGSWRTALTAAQVRAVVDAHGEVMDRFGYLKEVQAFPRGSRPRPMGGGVDVPRLPAGVAGPGSSPVARRT